MSVFQTANARGVSFTRNPHLRRNPYGKGWVIYAYSDDATLYDGKYIKPVGWADQVRGDGATNGYIAFRLKRDCNAALREAVGLGILQPYEF